MEELSNDNIVSENKENEQMINILNNFQKDGLHTKKKKFWKRFKPEVEMEIKVNEKNQQNTQNMNIFNKSEQILKIHLKKIRYI